MMNTWMSLVVNDRYLPGVLALRASLTAVQSAYPLVCLITDEVSSGNRDKLHAAGCVVREVETLDDHARPEFMRPEWISALTKLRIWQFCEYKRIVYLDADMTVEENIDELFKIDLPHQGLAAVPCCLCCFFDRYDGNRWMEFHCTFSETNYIPGRIAESRDYFNAGLLVIEPSKVIFERILNTCSSWDQNVDMLFSDQDVLNVHFRENWLKLSASYNYTWEVPSFHAEIAGREPIKNLHYVDTPKPWCSDEEIDAVKEPHQKRILNHWRDRYQG